MNPQEEVRVHEGNNLRVMGLEDFMDEFGFDPRQQVEEQEREQDNRKEIEDWDNS